MPLEILRQSNFNGGELSPQAIGRRDLKAYASSLALCVNMTPMAEGPVRRRPGLAFRSVVRNRLTVVDPAGATLSAPNGGDTAGVLTGASPLITTTAIGVTDGYVALEIDFGAPVEIGLVDLTDFALVATGGGGGDPEPAPPQLPWYKNPDYWLIRE